jgi:hypothetical protein
MEHEYSRKIFGTYSNITFLETPSSESRDLSYRRAGEQAGRRAGGQAGRRAGGQAGRRAGGQAGRRAGGQAGRWAEDNNSFLQFYVSV